jgi:bacteriorhodopsin
MDIIKITAYLSLFVQIIVAVIDIVVLRMNIPKTLTLLKEVLIMELIVQLIEGIFYVWLVISLVSIKTSKKNITAYRYYDWFLTTPTMLISLIFYFIYLKYKSTNDIEKLKTETFFSTLINNKDNLVPIVLLNASMLAFGLLGEKRYLPIKLSVFLGFIPFLIYYYLIYKNYVIQEYSSIFWYFFIVWAVYGIAALLPYYWKNSSYNILDLFAKNFFGLFLAYIIYKGIKEENNKVNQSQN